MNENRASPQSPPDSGDDVWQSRTVTIVNRRGLHARAAAKFAQLASGFDAEVTVTRKDMTVTADSIMGLMMLAAAPGSDLELKARGAAAADVLEALAALVANRFDEDV